MLLLRLKGQALTFLKQIENSIGTEATSTIKSIELLQQAFQKRFIDTSSLNKLKHGLVTCIRLESQQRRDTVQEKGNYMKKSY